MADASIMQEEDESSMLDSLFRSCRDGSAEDVESILSACPDLDINSADERGESALHVAAASGKLDTVALLINRGANINAATEGGDAVVHFAAKFGRLNIVKYLHEQHVNLNAINKWCQNYLKDIVFESILRTSFYFAAANPSKSP